MQRPGGLKRAITVFESAMDSYVHNQIMRIAVIGMGGTGKSSLINAFAGEEIAPTGSRVDTTRHPTRYKIGNMLFIDYPGYDTVNYTLEKFNEYFCWESFDLVLMLVNDRSHLGRMKICLESGMLANRCENVVYVCTHLDGIVRDEGENPVEIAEAKNKLKSKITSHRITAYRTVFPKRQAQGELRELRENEDVFFIAAPEPKRAYALPGFRELERRVRELSRSRESKS